MTATANQRDGHDEETRRQEPNVNVALRWLVGCMTEGLADCLQGARLRCRSDDIEDDNVCLTACLPAYQLLACVALESAYLWYFTIL